MAPTEEKIGEMSCKSYYILRRVDATLDATPKPFAERLGHVCYRTIYGDQWRQPDWCPKPLFEMEARPEDALPFGLALFALQIGFKSRIWRKEWNMQKWLELCDGAVCMRYATAKLFGPWIPTEEDLMAGDWAGST